MNETNKVKTPYEIAKERIEKSPLRGFTESLRIQKGSEIEINFNEISDIKGLSPVLD